MAGSAGSSTSEAAAGGGLRDGRAGTANTAAERVFAGRRDGAATLEGWERFAAFVAHELRDPVSTQRALVEVALADPHADAGALRQMGNGVVESCRFQQRLIEGLLDLVLSGRPGGHLERVDLAAIAAGALAGVELGGLASVVTLAPAPTTGDRRLLERLAANLVGNAVRHNTSGGRIEVATGAADGRAVLRVANTGPLIAASELTRLFLPFQRLAPRRSDASDGVGLGLAVVQAIADAHDATVTARPRRGGGLCVEVGFPHLSVSASSAAVAVAGPGARSPT